MEAKTYTQALVMTDRMDYLNNLGNNLAYCLAVEKLVELDVPAAGSGCACHAHRAAAHQPRTWSGWRRTRSTWRRCRSSCTASANAS